MNTKRRCEQGHHLVEAQYQPKKARQRPRFKVGCTECDALSREYMLRNQRCDKDGYPVDVLQAADDIYEWADGRIEE